MGVFYNADCLYVCLSVSQKRNTSGAAPRIPIFYTIADHIMVRKFTKKYIVSEKRADKLFLGGGGLSGFLGLFSNTAQRIVPAFCIYVKLSTDHLAKPYVCKICVPVVYYYLSPLVHDFFSTC